MDKPHWFRFYPNLLLSSSKVALMTTEEIGAYTLLLCHAWNDPLCSLPDDDAALQKLGRITCGLNQIRACFIAKGGRLVNKKLLEEWKHAKKTSQLKSHAADVRWQRTRNAPAMQVHIQTQSESESESEKELREEKKKKRAPTRRLTDEEFIESLKTSEAYKHVDFPVEWSKQDIWLSNNPGRERTRKFILNWLNKIPRPIDSTALHANGHCQWANDPEPCQTAPIAPSKYCLYHKDKILRAQLRRKT